MDGDIIDRIDAATGCQQCGGPLGLSPSGDFCSENCQVQWGHERVGATPDPLDGYRQRWMLGMVGSAEQRAYGRVMEVSSALRRQMHEISAFARRMERIAVDWGIPTPVTRSGVADLAEDLSGIALTGEEEQADGG